jgi:hypothetical protein
VPATVPKVSITLGFSSASIAAIESQFSLSLSSSRLLSLIVRSPAVFSLSARSSVGLNGVAGAMAGCRHLRTRREGQGINL